MTPRIEIDADSGFCFGVVTAIRKAEEELGKPQPLFCLGDIVHNSREVERLRLKGLRTITHSDLESLHGEKVLLRAHGEPPSTYSTARANGIEIIDATCPVVLALQRRIKEAYDAHKDSPAPPLILIYGKRGHAEVNGLVGQTEGTAIVVQSEEELEGIDMNRDILLYSQTTKSLDGFRQIVEAIKARKQTGRFEYFDTICRRVSGRMSKIRDFARSHEAILFVSGAKSSNGKVLFDECRAENPRTYMIAGASDIEPEMLSGAASIGICGATSTPGWLMHEVSDYIQHNLKNA